MSEVGSEYSIIWPLRTADRAAAERAAASVSKYLSGLLGEKALRVMDDALRIEMTGTTDADLVEAVGRSGVTALKETGDFSGGNGYKVVSLSRRV